MTARFRPTRRGLILGTAALLAAPKARAQEPLVLRAAKADLLIAGAGISTPAFNQFAAGPLLEMERGKPFAFKIENGIGFPLHFRAQGLRGKAVQGGETPIAPGDTREIVITPPDAGSFVYCAASEAGLHGRETILLGGPLIVGADQPRMADREIVVAVNAFAIPSAKDAAQDQRVVTVNGTSGINLTARPGERLLLRMINLAQEGIGGLRVPKDAQIVALDGQPCEPFPPFDGNLVVGPLGRADVTVDMPKEAGAKVDLVDPFDAALVLVAIKVEGETMPDRFLAKALPDNRALPKEIPLKSAERFTWKPLETPPNMRVKAGTSVVITFENDKTSHALLLEGHTARLLDSMDDGWKPWWHDVLLLPPEETQRFAFLPDVPGRYAIDLIPLEGNGAPTRGWVEVS